jgi:uncharacterized repeat protein (TIGR01451 family)
VTETLPAGWSQIIVTPMNGQVVVEEGSSCAGVVFKNRQSAPQGANLSLTKVASAPSVERGAKIAYQIIVSNSGPAAAENVIVRDPVPAGLTFIDAESDTSCDQQGNEIFCNIGTGPANQNRPIILTFQTQAAVGTCNAGSISNVATVHSSTSDPNTNDNQSQTVTTPLTCPVVQNGCIEIVKETFDTTGATLTPVAQFTFSLDGSRTTMNTSNGRARFDNVPVGTHTVTETIPTGWTQLSVIPSSGIVSVSPGNNTCTQVTFRNRQASLQPTLTITKTDNRTQAAPGDILSYSVSIANTSQNNAQGITITDTLPSFLTFRAGTASHGGNANGQVITWTNQTIPGNTTLTLTFQATVGTNAPNNLVVRNQAQIVGGPSATDDTTIIVSNNGGGLEIELDADPDPVELCEELEYEITVRNTSNQEKRDIEVVFVMPDEAEFEDASNDGDEDDGTVTWDSLDLPAGGKGTLQVTVTIDDDDLDDGDEIDASAFTDGDSDEISVEIDGNNCDDDDDDGDVTVRKTANPSEVFPGGIVMYEIVIENDTDEDMEDVKVEDRLSGSTYTIIDDGNAESSGGGVLRWEFDSIDAGDTETIRYRISVLPSAFPGEIIHNNVTVETDDDDWRASAVVSVIGTLPQTGGRNGGIFGKGSVFLRPFSGSSSSDASFPIVPWISIAGVVTGAGFTLGRKYWLGV